jgi:DNA-binding IscR family transcriptional regulator
MFDGAIAAVPCATRKFYESCDECVDETACSVRAAFLRVRNATVEMLKSDTIESLLAEETRMKAEKVSKSPQSPGKGKKTPRF